MFEGRPNCPKCNSIHVAPIQYGMPTEINTEAERLGEYVQAGCCIIIGVSPEWECLCCKHRWGAIGLATGEAIEGETR